MSFTVETADRPCSSCGAYGHPDHAQTCRGKTQGLHPQSLCTRDCPGCCNEAEGGF